MSTYSIEVEDSLFSELRRVLQFKFGVKKDILTSSPEEVLKQLFLVENPRYTTNPYDYRDDIKILKIKGE